MKQREVEYLKSQNLQLSKDVEGLRRRKNREKSQSSQSKVAQELEKRQVLLIKSKAEQIKDLNSKLQALTLRCANYDRLVSRNIDLTRQS